jgi:polar amino acid transport system permease protein
MAELLRAASAAPVARDDRGRPRLRLCRAQPVPSHCAAARDLAAIPMIGNQLIQIIKDNACLTIIAVPKLTHEASSIQATYFVPFTSFVIAVLLYWVLCMIVEAAVAGVGRMAEARR